MRELHSRNIEDMAIGSTVLATGGGGDPHLGKLVATHAIERYGPLKLIDASQVGDDDLIVCPALIGSPVPLIEKFAMGDELAQAFDAISKHFGGQVKAVMPIEAGGANSMVPFALGAQVGLPIVDGDGMGRAFPEVQLVTFTLYGISSCPMALADERGNAVILNAVDNHWTERFARSVCIDMGAIAASTTYPLTGSQLREAAILGSLSYAERIGKAIRQAKHTDLNPVEAARKETNGFLLFKGKIVDVQRRVTGGFAKGEAKLDGLDEFEGQELTVRFQNENLVALLDEGIIASVPDLITILDLETGQPITTEALRYGFRVAVLGIPCDAKWRTPAGIDLAGPRYFGYEVDYVPLEERYQEKDPIKNNRSSQ